MTQRLLPGARAALRRALGLSLPLLFLTALAPAASASVVDGATCTLKTGYALRDAIRAGSSVSGGAATLVVPAGLCPVTVSFTSYLLPSGDYLPFEEQEVFDNKTGVYHPGTYHLRVDLPDCAYQTDLYTGPLFHPLIPGVGHDPKIIARWDLGNLGTRCEERPECVNIDFETDDEGHRLHKGTVIDDEFAAFGITASSKDGEKLMIFDTANPTGGDTDLATPGSGTGNSTALGKVLILSEDGDSSDPDDDAGGGTMIFTFASPVEVDEVSVLDIDRGESATVRVYDVAVGGAPIATVNAADLGNNSFQTLAVGANGVRRLEVEFSSSGALAGFVICEEDDICVRDVAPPQIEYGFTGPDKVTIDVTDDTGIASIVVDLEDPDGGTPNLVLVGAPPDLSGFPTAVTLVYQIQDFTKNTLVRVVATDRCDKAQCPDDGDGSNDEKRPAVSFSPADGSDPDSDPDDANSGFAFHPDGLAALPIFFRLNNVEVVSNAFTDATETRADFFLETIDKSQGGTFGVIAASACNATVIDPEIDAGADDAPVAGAGAFREADGLVVMEAESGTPYASGGHAWEDLGAYDGSSGSALVAGPNRGRNMGDDLGGARLDFEVTFDTPGTYYLWARMSGNSTADNSVHAGIDGAAATHGRNGLDFYRRGWNWTNRVHWRPGSDRVRIEVDAPGTRTVSVWMREDGTRLDKILLTTDRYFWPRGNGPDESARTDKAARGPAVAAAATKSDLPSAGLVALEFGLGQNYPNPVAQSTTVEYTLAEPSTARLAVYNMLGQEVLVLADGHQEAGQYRVHLDASLLASGTYVYRLVTPTESATKRLTVVR